MAETAFFQDLAVVVLAALAAGAIAARLRLPVILGYLISGVIIGPHGLGWVRDPVQIDHMAQIGVVFLMFALGVEFSLADLKPVWRVAVGGGLLQIVLMVGLLAAAFWGLGFAPGTGVAIGCVLALSSTALVMRILTDRGDLDAAYGRILIGMLIVQDLAVLPMALLIPGLAGSGPASGAFLRQVAIGLGFVGGALGFGARVAPGLMARVAAFGKELFFLTVVAACLGLAEAAHLFGVSAAIGAFLAGLVISESEQSKQALADILPLRDLFATIFFVSLGMLLDPGLALAHAGAVSALLVAILVGKALLGILVCYLFGYSGRTAIGVGLGVAQIGEFSFVLAGIASRAGLIPPAWFAAILGASILSLMAAPFMMASIGPLGRYLSRARWPRGFMRERAYRLERMRPARLRGHVVVAGYGRMGHQVGDELRRWGVPFLVVDLNHRVTEQLRESGEHAVYGDASRAEVLRHCNLREARMLVVALPDATSVELCLVGARQLAPEIEVIVRAHRSGDADAFYALGAKEVVQPEFEASLEAIRQVLAAYEFPPTAVAGYLHQIRARRYVSLRVSTPLDFGALPPLAGEGMDVRWLQIQAGAPATRCAVHELEHPPDRGVVILAVRRDGFTHHAPGSLDRLQPHDHVLVMGTHESIIRFEQLATTGPDRLAGGNGTG